MVAYERTYSTLLNTSFFFSWEVNNLIWDNFFEWMACGSAYIGLDSSMYRDLGLIPGVHYIAYDGTKDGLKQIVEYYQKEENQKELEHIAQTGYQYVTTHFKGEVVADNLLKNLTAEQEQWKNSQ